MSKNFFDRNVKDDLVTEGKAEPGLIDALTAMLEDRTYLKLPPNIKDVVDG